MRRLEATLLSAALIGAGAATGALGIQQAPGAQAAGAEAADSARNMRETARGLLLSLPVPDRNVVENSFDDSRLEWNYTPVDRDGLALGGLTEQQREEVWRFLATGLGERGLTQAEQIITLEQVLYEASGGNPMRDPGLYWLNLYGTPATRGSWGWRFEGHHLSVNFTVFNDRVVGATPAFFGGNPALVESGPHLDLRPFAVEEDSARALLQSLDAEQRAEAVVSAAAHPDVLTTNQHYAQPLADNGLSYSAMAPGQQRQLLALLEHYASRLQQGLAARELDEIHNAGLEKLRFAWAGGLEPGERHYYRIQGPTFVVEYDNSQGDANHVHTVWRNFARDFGRDPLREHLAAHHHDGARGAHPHADPGESR